MQKDANQIWSEFHRELKSFILNKTRDANDSDDLLQEVFLKIIQNMHRINQAENLRKYLFAMVRNTLNDYYRKKELIQEFSDDYDVIDDIESESLNATIANCCITPFIYQLPEKYKEALLITEFQNVSQKELAEKLNISYSGAKSRVQRAKEKLKELILGCCALEIDSYGNVLDKKKNTCRC